MTLELRALNDLSLSGDGNKVEGYAVVYNSPSQLIADRGGRAFTEVILPGAPSQSLQRDIRALYSHQKGAILGRTSAGTLTLREDSKGIHYSVSLPDTSTGRD